MRRVLHSWQLWFMVALIASMLVTNWVTDRLGYHVH